MTDTIVLLKVPVHTAIDISFENMKPKDPVWSNFEVLDSENSKEQKAKCLNCNAIISARAPRLKSHLQKCGNFESCGANTPKKIR